MEVVGTVASVFGLAGVALQIAKSLNDDIDAIKNAPDTLKKVSTDLTALTPVLHTLQDAASSKDAAIQQRLHAVVDALQSCVDTCRDFDDQLKVWTKRSATKDASRMSTTKFALFGKTRMQTLRFQISCCKETLTLVLVATHL
jgi:hypothetical protein